MVFAKLKIVKYQTITINSYLQYIHKRDTTSLRDLAHSNRLHRRHTLLHLLHHRNNRHQSYTLADQDKVLDKVKMSFFLLELQTYFTKVSTAIC